MHPATLSREIRTRDVMMRSDFRAAEAREKAFRHIRANTIRAVRFAMIDAHRFVARVHHVPMRRFVGIHGAAVRDASL